MPFVTLTPEEWQEAVECGTARRAAAAKRGRNEPHGHPTDREGNELDLLALDIASSAAEKVVSVYTGLKWHNEIISGGLIEYPCDVGDDIEVRWTPYDHGHLPVYEKDRIENRYVLVCGPKEGRTFRIAGWLPGERAKRDIYWRLTPRKIYAYWISQNSLRSGLELSKSYSHK